MTYVVMYANPFPGRDGLTWARLEGSTIYNFQPKVHGDKPVTDNLYMASDATYMVSMTQDPEEVEDLKTLLWEPPVKTDTCQGARDVPLVL